MARVIYNKPKNKTVLSTIGGSTKLHFRTHSPNYSSQSASGYITYQVPKKNVHAQDLC